MPFVKKTDAKGFQPLTDARKIFIGRTNELHFFVKDILEPGDPAYNIVSISGQGGVGKSTLLLRFIDDAYASNFKDYCLTAIVNERQTTPAAISKMVNRLETIATLDLQHHTAFVCRGVAAWVCEDYEKALAMLDQATLLDPDNWDAYFWKALVLASLQRDEEAKVLVEKALENNLPPALLAPLRWFEQDKPDFYRKHAIPLLARYEC